MFKATIFAVFLPLLVFPSADAEPVRLLPVEAFAGLPDVKQVRLSPNGKRVAALVKVDTDQRRGTTLFVYNVETEEKSFPVYTDNRKFVFNWIKWASDRRILASARYPAVRYGIPSTETRMLIIDAETGETRPAIRANSFKKYRYIPQFQANIIDDLPDEPDNILLSLALDSPDASRVVKLNLETRKHSLFERNRTLVVDWLTDRQHNLRIGFRFEGTRHSIIHRGPGEKKWDTLWEFEAFSEDQVWPVGFDFDPRILYVRAYHDDKLALFKVNLSSSDLKRELVYSDPDYDVDGSLIYSRKSEKVIGTTYSTDGGFTFWDERYEALQNGLDMALPDTRNSLYSFSADERRYIVLATSDTDAGTYFFGNRDTGEISPLARRYNALMPELMAEKSRISYPARDGLQIEAYLTRPKNAADEPLPTVIFPHGGPISHDDGRFDYWTQFLANRGYAVMQMNFRGSAGYGHAFMSMGLQNWGLEMQNDVEDGTRWAIEKGLADPERICVVGASYGGYAALMEAAGNPDLYRCAVSFAGVTDVVFLVQSSRKYLTRDVVRKQIGSDFKSLRRRSPVNLAEDIDVPVLLVHGSKDRRVEVRHSRSMHKALTRAGKDSIYIEQEDGDHHLSNQEHRLELFREMDVFLQRHLKPKSVSAAH